jgi:hypothetical protein
MLGDTQLTAAAGSLSFLILVSNSSGGVLEPPEPLTASTAPLLLSVQVETSRGSEPISDPWWVRCGLRKVKALRRYAGEHAWVSITTTDRPEAT